MTPIDMRFGREIIESSNGDLFAAEQLRDRPGEVTVGKPNWKPERGFRPPCVDDLR